MQKYDYVDETVGKGTLYYSLKQVDYDGAWEHSPITSVLVKDANTYNDIEISYSTSGIVRVSNTDALVPTSVSIYNINGALISNEVLQSTNYVDLVGMDIPEGLYIVTATNAAQMVSRKVYKPM